MANPKAPSPYHPLPTEDARLDETAQPTDEVLFERFIDGDTAAYRTLIERYHDDLLRFLTRLVGDRAAAEDVFQETFLTSPPIPSTSPGDFARGCSQLPRTKAGTTSVRRSDSGPSNSRPRSVAPTEPPRLWT